MDHSANTNRKGMVWLSFLRSDLCEHVNLINSYDSGFKTNLIDDGYMQEPKVKSYVFEDYLRKRNCFAIWTRPRDVHHVFPNTKLIEFSHVFTLHNHSSMCGFHVRFVGKLTGLEGILFKRNRLFRSHDLLQNFDEYDAFDTYLVS